MPYNHTSAKEQSHVMSQCKLHYIGIIMDRSRQPQRHIWFSMKLFLSIVQIVSYEPRNLTNDVQCWKIILVQSLSQHINHSQTKQYYSDSRLLEGNHRNNIWKEHNLIMGEIFLLLQFRKSHQKLQFLTLF